MPEGVESRLGRAYRRFYDAICGQHPNLMPWHFQWLSALFINRDLERLLPKTGGRILDVGCGKRPYQPLLSGISNYVGIDVIVQPYADVVVPMEGGWPFPDASFDIVLMTQVLEYLREPSVTLAEIRRVLRPGGVALVSFPFIYNEHGNHDYLRYSGQTAATHFPGFNVMQVERQGGIGTTLAILFLNWLHTSLNWTTPLRWLRPLLLPFWLPFCLIVNLAGLMLNRLDVTAAFYSNVLLQLLRDGAEGRRD